MDNVYSRLKLINCQYFKGILFKCKGLHDFGKRMISELLEEGCSHPPPPPGCYGPGLGVGPRVLRQ